MSRTGTTDDGDELLTRLGAGRSVERACQELVEVLEHLTAGEAADGRAPPQQDGSGRRRGD
jgi:hypothetical protein